MANRGFPQFILRLCLTRWGQWSSFNFVMVGPKSNTDRKNATRKGPKINLRFRNKREVEDVRRVAKRMGMSINTYILTEVLAQARNHLSYRG